MKPKLIALLLVLIASTRLTAQLAGPAEKRRTAEASLTAPAGITDSPQAGVFATVLASSDTKTGSVRLNVENLSGSFVFGAGVSGPLDQGTKAAEPVNLLGLTNGAAVDVSLHWLYWKAAMDFDELKRLCTEVAHRPTDNCDDSHFPDRASRKLFNRVGHATDAPVIVDVTGSFGPARYTFATPDQLKSAAEDHNSWNVAIAVGRFDPRYGYLKAEYGYQRQWLARGPQQICQPFVVGSLRCSSIIVGGPREGIGEVLDGEWRYFLPGRHVAVNPVVQRDFHEDVTSIQVPFYFLSNGNGGLTGGARWSWRSDTRESAVVVFVGTVLKLIG